MKRRPFAMILVAILVLTCCSAVADEQSPPLVRTLGGLQGNVEVIIDKYGIPHIYAEHESDAMFALGYLHARDRLWQMDFSRRAAGGRLSEIMGADTLQHDIFVRTVGIERLARASRARAEANPVLTENLEAYTWGVNSYIAGKMPEELPAEFNLMNYQPDPWSPTDSLAIGKAMAWELTGSLDDLYMATLVEKLGPEAVAELFPIDRYREIPIIPPTEKEKTTEPTSTPAKTPPFSVETARGYLDIIETANHQVRILSDAEVVGSNNWVIDGTKSSTGKPILASDPHLGLHLPPVWYAAHVCVGSLDVIGVTLPGYPAVIIGHNRNIAWGVTNTQADVTDFFIETLNEEQTHYLHKGEWKQLEDIDEIIEVRGGTPHELRVRLTAHGPILPSSEATLSMQWTGAEPDNDATAFFLLDHAVDYDDFAAAMQTINTPAQNFNYADTNGMIAMWVAGLFPIRGEGHGRIPADGSSGEYDWKGFIPKIDTPHAANPPQHYLASANQRPAPEDYPYYLGYEWDPGYRARRINELLTENESITVDQMKAFQADTRDMAAESMLPHLIAACKDGVEPGSLYAKTLDTLSSWNFFTTVDSPAPTIWWKWMERLSDDVWADEWHAAGIELREESWGYTDLNQWRPPMEVLESIVVEQPTSRWFDDVSTDSVETLREIALKSLREAVDDLFMRMGPEIAEWKWGSVNRLRIDHLSGNPLLRRGGHPLDGSDLALNARGSGGDVSGGPSWRMIVDFTDLSRAYGIFPGGQSGNPENAHYDDLINPWVQNKYIPLLFYPSPDKFPQEEIESRLSLMPTP